MVLRGVGGGWSYLSWSADLVAERRISRAVVALATVKTFEANMRVAGTGESGGSSGRVGVHHTYMRSGLHVVSSQKKAR